jgi:hypothetical protein
MEGTELPNPFLKDKVIRACLDTIADCKTDREQGIERFFAGQMVPRKKHWFSRTMFTPTRERVINDIAGSHYVWQLTYIRIVNKNLEIESRVRYLLNMAQNQHGHLTNLTVSEFDDIANAYRRLKDAY